jgi:hypothetical protein
MDPAFRDRAPRLILDDNGKERLLVEGKVLGNPKGLGRLGAVGARDGSVGARRPRRLHRTPQILWATDYPHADGFFPGTPDLIAKRSGLSAATKREILAGGAMRFYGLA